METRKGRISTCHTKFPRPLYLARGSHDTKTNKSTPHCRSNTLPRSQRPHPVGRPDHVHLLQAAHGHPQPAPGIRMDSALPQPDPAGQPLLLYPRRCERQSQSHQAAADRQLRLHDRQLSPGLAGAAPDRGPPHL